MVVPNYWVFNKRKPVFKIDTQMSETNFEICSKIIYITCSLKVTSSIFYWRPIENQTCFKPFIF